LQGIMIQNPASVDMHGFEIPGQVEPDHGRRRITAESFRLLTARLKVKAVPVETAPVETVPVETAPVETVPVPVPELPIESELLWPELGFPVQATPPEPEIIIPEPEILAPEPVAQLPDENIHEDVVPLAFAPLWPLEIEDPQPEHAVETVAFEPDEEIAPETPEASATPSDADFETVVTGEAVAPPVLDIQEWVLDKPTPLLAERVVDAMLQTVIEAIYAKPSGAERAAFLRETAPMIEEGIPPVAAPSAESIFDSTTGLDVAEDIPATLADKLGPATALLLKQPEAPDPFSLTVKDAIRLPPKPAEPIEVDFDAGELALSLLDMMSAGSGSGLPQERALAADTLLRMIPRVPVKQLIMVVERVAIMEAPPSLLVAKLIRDPRAEVVAPLLERCMHITDQDLIAAATEGDPTKRRMIARRRILSPVLADHLIAIGDPSTLLTLIRNPGAGFSHEAFHRLADHASQHHSLLAPLTTRADLPAPVAFELFWFVPQELRRFIFSRFLTDSETLTKILKITLGAQEGSETKFPPRELLESAIDTAAQGKLEDAAQSLADIGGVCQDTAIRILSDPNGEPVTVLLKALGFARAKFAGAMEGLQRSGCQTLRPERNVTELESLFDTLSFNKARILLTYWDWFVQKSGPYAPQH